MKNVLITGINGSGATYLTELLSTKPDLQIYGISRWHTDRQKKSGILKNIKILECDLTDFGSVFRALDESRPDYIFHLAANANVKLSFKSPVSVFQNNSIGTLNLLECLRIMNLKPLVQFSSTSEVYGQVKKDDIPISELHNIDPINVYAVSKLAQEKLVKSYFLSYGIPIVITRAFGYINPRRPDIFSSAFARQIADIEKGKQDVLYHGNLESVRTLLDVRDICEAYWLAANNCEVGEAYNIGGSVPISVAEFLDVLKTHARCRIKTEMKEDLLRPVDVTLQIPDVSKFANKTNFMPKYSLSESIEFLLDFYRNQ